ncbi:LPS export ABC transporter periplasmic protein LptC [Luteimonas sp. e5]
MSRRGVLRLVLLVAAIAVGWGILHERRQPPGEAAAQARADYLLHDFEIIALRKDGSEGFTLRAPQLARSPDTREMDIDNPVFTFPHRDGSHWRSRSASGWVDGEGNHLRLRGDVQLDNPDGDSGLTMQTEALDVFRDRDIATSDGLVTITQPGSIARGRGLEARLDENRFILKSEVRAQYAPSIK